MNHVCDDYKQHLAKRDHARHYTGPAEHACHWPGCARHIKATMWACSTHWFRLPRAIRERLWRAYRPTQPIDVPPSAAYAAAESQALCWIEQRRQARLAR